MSYDRMLKRELWIGFCLLTHWDEDMPSKSKMHNMIKNL